MNFSLMYIKSILLCVLILLVFVGCDPKEALDPTNRCLWIVKNSTGEAVWIKSGLSVDEFEKYLKVGESKTFDRGGVSKDGVVDFQDFFSVYINGGNSSYQTVEIYNADKTKLLKKWRISESTNSGRQFFNESYWTKKEWSSTDPYEHFTDQSGWYNYYEWTFEILPEDIAP